MKLQESERTEFKSIVVTDIKKEIIAFANCDGGKIYIGIEDDGTVIGVEDSDSVALQVSNMVRDAIKPDLTMFLHYETKEIEQKQVVIIDIQRGTERPYYIAKKGLRPEGVYVRQGYSSVPATDTAIRKMIKETDGDHFEDMRSLDQELTFCETKKEFQKRNITLEQPKMEFIRILLYYFQTNACIRLKQQFLKERIKIYLKIEKNLQDHYLHKWKQYMITLTSEIKHIQLLKNFIELIIEIIQK